MKTEILAPAGSFNALRAAVLSGADAVYFGTGSFNARRNADNFNSDELKRAIDYCHLHGVKCHITLNTLVLDSELDRFSETVKRVCELNADALILQDLAAARIVRRLCPEIELHASTQMSTGTLEGLKLLEQLGFSRAVLPRELSKREILYLCEHSPIDLECFVHGALCMCVSGQCLLSSMLGSRSGNRGLCAQPCRLPFKAENGTGHDLSLKDLSIIESIGFLSRAGVSSFKIEGRMKRPEYVSAAVTACRESLEGTYSEQRKHELKSLFSRSGFTDGYFEGKLSREMFGIRERENVVSASSELLKKYEKNYEKEIAVHGVSFRLSAQEGKAPVLTASTAGHCVTAEGTEPAQRALNKALSVKDAVSQLSKCGGTVFYPEEIECNIKGELFVPMSTLNSLRRNALSLLEEKIIGEKRRLNEYVEEIPEAIPVPGRAELYSVFDSVAQIPDAADCGRIFLPLDTPDKALEEYNAGVVVPRGLLFNSDEVYERLASVGAEYALCNTLDAVSLAKKAGKKIIGGPFLNIFNSLSLDEIGKLGAEQVTLSYELTAEQIKKMTKSVKTGCVLYGRTPLMITANCPVKNGKNCAECKRSCSLTDRKGIEFPIRCTNGFSELFNSRPTYMLDKADAFGRLHFHMLVFTTETARQVSNIINAYYAAEKPDAEFTRGLYFRGVE